MGLEKIIKWFIPTAEPQPTKSAVIKIILIDCLGKRKIVQVQPYANGYMANWYDALDDQWVKLLPKGNVEKRVNDIIHYHMEAWEPFTEHLMDFYQGVEPKKNEED